MAFGVGLLGVYSASAAYANDNANPAAPPAASSPSDTSTPVVEPSSDPTASPSPSVASSDTADSSLVIPGSSETLSAGTTGNESASAAPTDGPAPVVTPEGANGSNTDPLVIPGSTVVVGQAVTTAAPSDVQSGNDQPNDPSPPAVSPTESPIARTDATDTTVVTSEDTADPNQDPLADTLAPPEVIDANLIDDAPVADPNAPVVVPPVSTPAPQPAASDPSPADKVGKGSVGPKGGYTIHTDLLGGYADSVTADELRNAIEAVHPGSPLADLAPVFVAEAHANGEDPLALEAHAAIESAWGTSHIAQTKGNLYGMNAFDSNPGAATKYSGPAESIKKYASYMKDRYLTPGNWRYQGPTLHGIFVHYSSSHDKEARSVVSVMKGLVKSIVQQRNEKAKAKAQHDQPATHAARNAMPKPPENYTKVHYRGVELNVRTKFMLKTAERTARKAGVPTPLDLAQGSYHPGVDKSGGTHDGGGALDVRVQGMTGTQIDSTVKALREAGFAAWHRTPDQGFSPHIHAEAIGDVSASPSAQKQVKAFFTGQNGLANHGPDTDANLGATLPSWTNQYR